MKLCVFQGTFDPIHRGHTELAEFAVEELGFDRIVFIPAFIPPHKKADYEMAIHRLNMVKLATEGHERFEFSDIEYTLGGVSYTYLTILELYKKFDVCTKINFIIGSDAFSKIESWYESERLKTLIDFVLFSREKDFDSNKFLHLKEKGYNYVVAEKPFSDVSSSVIREMSQHGQDAGMYLDKRVSDYIKEHGLYKY